VAVAAISHVFSVQKDGLRLSEIEDACWPRPRLDESSWNGKREHAGAQQLRFAISDGATETLFSKLWARQLVRAFGNGDLQPPCEEIENREGRRWNTVVKRYLRRRHNVPWFIEEKLEVGTFATILGLTFSADSETGTFEAVAVGDSCVIQMDRHDASVLAQFPLNSSDSFNARPELLGTNRISHRPKWLQQSSRFKNGDVFYLMTDALACWFYMMTERGRAPWNVLAGLQADEPGAHDDFRSFIVEMRSKREMRNDDVMLLRVEPRVVE
jgi:hypothetical protein